MDKEAKEIIYGKIIEDDVEPLENNKENYKVVTVSLYNEDFELLNHYLKVLKSKGANRINKSKIIRHALRELDIETFPLKD